MKGICFRDLAIERFAAQPHPTLLLERNRHLCILDQVPIAFRLRPPATFHGSMCRSIFAEPKCLGIVWIYLSDLVVNFDLGLILPKFVIQATKLMQHFQVTRVFFQQGPQGKDADFRPARRHCRLL